MRTERVPSMLVRAYLIPCFCVLKPPASLDPGCDVSASLVSGALTAYGRIPFDALCLAESDLAPITARQRHCKLLYKGIPADRLNVVEGLKQPSGGV